MGGDLKLNLSKMNCNSKQPHKLENGIRLFQNRIGSSFQKRPINFPGLLGEGNAFQITG
jgi:hypothetical protein